MKFTAIQKGDEVVDRWWPWKFVGPVVSKTNTHLTIQTSAGPIRYDRPHCQFLEAHKRHRTLPGEKR